MKRLFNVSLIFTLILALGSILAACTGYTPPLLTETPSPTRTRRLTDTPLTSHTSPPADTPTDLPLPTRQIEPTRTDPAEAPTELTLRLGEVQEVLEGGFSFQPVVGYDVNILPGQATLVSKDGGIVLSLAGGDVPGANALEGVMDRLLARVSEDFEEFEAGDSYPIIVDESRGLAANVSAELIGKPVAGKVAVVAPSGSQLFYAFAFTIEEPDDDRWETEGSEVFEAIMDTVRFSELDDEGDP